MITFPNFSLNQEVRPKLAIKINYIFKGFIIPTNQKFLKLFTKQFNQFLFSSP